MLLDYVKIEAGFVILVEKNTGRLGVLYVEVVINTKEIMQKKIKLEVNKLFEEMKKEVRKVWLDKKYSHRWRGWRMREYSDTVMSFRVKALRKMKDITFLWSQEERWEFCRWFWRKTTPYLWLNKSLLDK